MKVFAQMCVRNEADRYFADALDWVTQIVDGVHVYDDRSTDDTAIIADRAGARVTIRPPDATPFDESESKFRGEAWSALKRAFDPDVDDWVLTVDADEFLVGTDPLRVAEREILLELVADAVASTEGFQLPIPEVFGFSHGWPLIRADGLWRKVHGLRLVRWTERPFKNAVLAGGSVPADITSVPTSRLAILHYGYADPRERQARYERYVGRPGHNPRHVESIVTTPKLDPWGGNAPPVQPR